MLILRSIGGPRESRDVLEIFDPLQATWVVSDLKSKLDLNRHLLVQRDYLPGESVMRASELWRVLLTRLRPDLQIVSREFIITLIAHRLSTMELEWAQAPGVAQTAYDYMTQLMPVLAHPNGEEMMREWYLKHAESETRWGRWFDLSLTLWRHFLEEGFVSPAWASGVLVNEAGLGDVWSKPLFIDLGAELNQVEADLLCALSTHVDVTVLRPEPVWKDEYAKCLVAYDIFERKIKVQKVSSKREIASEVGAVKKSVHYRKMTTMLAEVKDATAQVRQWLSDSNGSLQTSRIAIVAPDIESYWPALSMYLAQEGIPTQKDKVRRLHSYPDIVRWLAAVRLRMGSYAESDVEIALFETSGQQPRMMTFDRFKTLYSTIYGREDLARSADVGRRFQLNIESEDDVLRDDFIAWALKQLPEEVEIQRVESVFKKLFAECPSLTRFAVRRWVAYLEQIASKTECRIADGDPDGVACLNLSSAENSPATHMIVLGLTEAALRNGKGTSILFGDISSLAYEFGFHLASEDQAKLEFEAKWIMEGQEREMILSVPETDFSGAAQAASWLWVSGARDKNVLHDLSVPESTRWDELQRSGLDRIAQERKWSRPQADFLKAALAEDFGEAPLALFGQLAVERLSPSGIEDYLDCPFVFAAKRLFGLSDVAELDLEVDASRRGNLMHKVFELLTIEPIRTDLSHEEIERVVEDAREKSGLELADARLWPPLKAKHIDLAKRFLAFEGDYRTQFPEAKTIGREVDIAGYIRPSTGELIRNEEPGVLKFIGRIDRIDADSSGRLAIFDYKSSMSTASQWGSWLEKNQIQLLLYSIAIERGLTVFNPQPVLSALYYVARPLNREYGFKVEGAEQGLYETGDKRKRNRLSFEQKEALFAAADAKVKEAVAGIQAGRFHPVPRDQKDCPSCQWSALCRAPHLSP